MLGDEDFFADIFSGGGADTVIDIASPAVPAFHAAGVGGAGTDRCQHRVVGADDRLIERVFEYDHCVGGVVVVKSPK